MHDIRLNTFNHHNTNIDNTFTMTDPTRDEFFEVLEDYDRHTLYRSVSRLVYGSPSHHHLVARVALYHFFQVWVTRDDPRYTDYHNFDIQSNKPLIELLDDPAEAETGGDYTRLLTIVANAHNIRLQVTTARNFGNPQERQNQQRRHAQADYTIFVPQVVHGFSTPQLCEVGPVGRPVFHLGLRHGNHIFSTLLPDWEGAEFTELIHQQRGSLEATGEIMATRPVLIAAEIYNTQKESDMPRELERCATAAPEEYIQDDLLRCLNAFVGTDSDMDTSTTGSPMVGKALDLQGPWLPIPIEDRVVVLQVPPRLPSNGGFSRQQVQARTRQRSDWIASMIAEVFRLASQFMVVSHNIDLLCRQLFSVEGLSDLNARDTAFRETAKSLLTDLAHELFRDPDLFNLAILIGDGGRAWWGGFLDLAQDWKEEKSFLLANRLLLNRAYPALVVQDTDDTFRTNFHFPNNAQPFVAPRAASPAAPPATSAHSAPSSHSAPSVHPELSVRSEPSAHSAPSVHSTLSAQSAPSAHSAPSAPPAPATPVRRRHYPNRTLLLVALLVLGLGLLISAPTPSWFTAVQQKATKPMFDPRNQQASGGTHSASGRLESPTQSSRKQAVLNRAVQLAAIEDAYLKCPSPPQTEADGTFAHLKKGCKILARQRNIRSRSSASEVPRSNVPPPLFAGDVDTIALGVIEDAYLKCFPPPVARADGGFVRLDPGCKLIVSKQKVKKAGERSDA